MEWNEGQRRLIGKLEWHRRHQTPGKVLAVSGKAGTGKTTVIARWAARVAGAVAVAPTNAAARRLTACGLPASTIHSALYEPEEVDLANKLAAARDELAAATDENVREDLEASIARITKRMADIEKVQGVTTGVRFHKRETNTLTDATVTIVDEASMVPKHILRDITKASGGPVVLVGDRWQLPPVNGQEAFSHTDVELTKVERSGGALGRLAGYMYDSLEGASRKQGLITRWLKDSDAVGGVNVLAAPGRKVLMSADIALCLSNGGMFALNAMKRRLLGIDSPYPQVGEPVVAFGRIAEAGIFKNELFTVEELGARSRTGRLRVMKIRSVATGRLAEVNMAVWRFMLTRKLMLDILEGGNVTSLQWSDLRHAAPPGSFGFGYACTVHSAQGCEWDRVVLVDDAQWMDHTGRTQERNRLLYTAATRARKLLHYGVMHPTGVTKMIRRAMKGADMQGRLL